MPLYFPRNVAGLAALVARDPGRYSYAAVHVLDPGDGLYRLEATDGRRLAIIQGPIPEAAYPQVEDGPDELTDGLISREDWVQAFRLGDKKQPVGLAGGGDEVTFAVGNHAIKAQTAGECFPDVQAVLPKHGPLVAVCVNPELLAGLLNVAAALNPDGGVMLLYYGKDKPLGLVARNSEGQAFDALLMPLS